MDNILNISKAIETLEEYFKDKGKTTLNEMRNDKSREAPFKILIACLISLRTQDKNTEIAANRLFSVAQTPEEILALPIEKLEELIYSSGHYKKKSQTLKSVSKEILERFKGSVPDTREELLSIKGIGPKTAAVVLGFAYGQTVIPVDVNVHRIANRLGWVNTKTAEKTETELMNLIPKRYWKELNAIFMLHGKNICVPLSPHCSICPVSFLCPKKGVERSR